MRAVVRSTFLYAQGLHVLHMHGTLACCVLVCMNACGCELLMVVM